MSNICGAVFVYFFSRAEFYGGSSNGGGATGTETEPPSTERNPTKSYGTLLHVTFNGRAAQRRHDYNT